MIRHYSDRGIDYKIHQSERETERNTQRETERELLTRITQGNAEGELQDFIVSLFVLWMPVRKYGENDNPKEKM